jgi:hypothetical protein
MKVKIRIYEHQKEKTLNHRKSENRNSNGLVDYHIIKGGNIFQKREHSNIPISSF